jgi:hypothetical protein
VGKERSITCSYRIMLGQRSEKKVSRACGESSAHTEVLVGGADHGDAVGALVL